MNRERCPKNAAERRAWIHYQLALRGMNFAKLARMHGLSRTCVIGALYGPYPRMERIIADVLGTEPALLWPERYTKAQATREKR